MSKDLIKSRNNLLKELKKVCQKYGEKNLPFVQQFALYVVIWQDHFNTINRYSKTQYGF